MERSRCCARPTCASPAVATLSYDYASRTAWIDDLTEAPDPAGYDLCLAHADGLRVPVGWASDDRRSPVISLRPPIAV